MLLYIHVPFCRQKCRYCAFHSLPLAPCDAHDGAATPHASLSTKGAASQHDIEDYLDTLFREMTLWGDRLGPVPVESVFFGGGTPSLLPPRIVGAILDRAARCFNIAADAEISLEANPESLHTRKQAGELLATGVNRLSLGVQALDDALLHLMGRPHRARDAVRAFHAAREAGFANISLDFIWGLPGQRLKQWIQQLREVVRLRPDHLSCYGITLEEGTPLSDDVQAGRLTLPGDREQAAMFMQGAELLEEAGYLQYEISNFARMGYQCRHNLGYWEGCDYLGLGPSAASTLQGVRRVNYTDHLAWREAVHAGRATGEAEPLDLPTRVLELVMLRLRTARGLRVKAYDELTGRNFMRDHKQLVHLLHDNGLIRLRDGYLRLTRNGMLVSNSILERFFEQTHLVLPTPPATPAVAS